MRDAPNQAVAPDRGGTHHQGTQGTFTISETNQGATADRAGPTLLPRSSWTSAVPARFRPAAEFARSAACGEKGLAGCLSGFALPVHASFPRSASCGTMPDRACPRWIRQAQRFCGPWPRKRADSLSGLSTPAIGSCLFRWAKSTQTGSLAESLGVDFPRRPR